MSSIPAVERTLIVVKPDATARGLVGEIIGRFERRGLKPVEIRMQTVSKVKGTQFYIVHKDKPFFGDLVSFISSGPSVGVVLEAERLCMSLRPGCEPWVAYIDV